MKNRKLKIQKHLNSLCFCKQNLYSTKTPPVMCIPCEHILHDVCFYKLSQQKCPFCCNKIEEIRIHGGLRTTMQQNIDILSVSNIDRKSKTDFLGIFNNSARMCTILKDIFEPDVPCSKIARDILSLCNAKITVYGKSNLTNIQQIFIANHSCHLDAVIISSIINTTYLASNAVTKTYLGLNLIKHVPCLIIKRGLTKNTVEQITNHVKKNNNICIFPEGSYSNPRTLFRFRTGAFYTGFPVCPIVIKYNNLINDFNPMDFILKIGSNKTINVDVHILEPVLPPFDAFKIENVRKKMAKCGGLFLSRVTSRDVKEDDTNRIE